MNTVTPLNTPSLLSSLYYLRLRVSPHWLSVIIGQQAVRGKAGGYRAACLQILTVLISCSERLSRCIYFLFFLYFSGDTELVSGRTMFLCRTGRLPAAAALDQAFKSTGSFLVQVKANRLRDVTLTLRKDYMSQGRRCFCVSVHDSTRAHLKKQQPDPQPVQNWDTSSGFVISDWVHPSKKAQSDASKSDIIRQLLHANTCYSNRGELPVGDVLFTGNWRVSSRHCSTRTMHTTATSTKKRDTGEEQTADNNKGVI